MRVIESRDGWSYVVGRKSAGEEVLLVSSGISKSPAAPYNLEPDGLGAVLRRSERDLAPGNSESRQLISYQILLIHAF